MQQVEIHFTDLTELAGCYVDLKKQTPNLKIFEEFRSSSAH